jgi:hypothetical protein
MHAHWNQELCIDDMCVQETVRVARLCDKRTAHNCCDALHTRQRHQTPSLSVYFGDILKLLHMSFALFGTRS